ncbi:hypothetical protein DV736_g3749, partial [Chaetothyriales sp. CBS 134916]
MAAKSDYKLLRNGIVLVHDSSDHVKAQYDTDILIKDDMIEDVGSCLPLPTGHDVQTIDCTGKIISPGFIDTHHHLWQTQLKGRHADEALLDYFPSGMLQSYNYQPDDVFWGQLSGSLEAIDAGTTFVLDHMHGAYTRDHADAGLKAGVASGLRMVYALAPPIRIDTWDKEKCVPDLSGPPVQEWNYEFVEEKCKQHPIDGRVFIGFGFDGWYMPKEYVQTVFERTRKAGIKVMTNHIGHNKVYYFDPIHAMKEYGLLDKDIVTSHCNGLDSEKKKILYDAGVYSSSTPETECQMGMGWPVALDEYVNGCLGTDCHTNNSSSILVQARMLLQQIRQREAEAAMAKGTLPKVPVCTSEQAFNLATIAGARAVGLENEIGSIKKGKKADLVVFDSTNSPSMLCSVEYDPLIAVLRHSDLRDIDTVIIGGFVRKQGGKLLPVTIDGKNTPYGEIVQRTLQSRKAIQQRIDGTSWEKAREMIVRMFHVDESKII